MREFKLLTGQRVIVVSDSASLRGVVDSATRSSMTLRDVESVGGPSPYPVDGVVIVPISKINYVQVT
ncbi:hypothetical protein E3T43_07285 [Cryobacterium sp. Hh7]|uniref:hypothetical protein n=1 Tax=Cryobacterium sp. Hh7 TaxID=1259159 RepID=UPI00106C98CD|nr:hypothetical protein [Cryobacterium sp. Hh7]TFD58042.1 hypothetical protein E3T43_07285 [Cryobacterium sp. Hh7]